MKVESGSAIKLQQFANSILPRWYGTKNIKVRVKYKRNSLACEISYYSNKRAAALWNSRLKVTCIEIFKKLSMSFARGEILHIPMRHHITVQNRKMLMVIATNIPTCQNHSKYSNINQKIKTTESPHAQKINLGTNILHNISVTFNNFRPSSSFT